MNHLFNVRHLKTTSFHPQCNGLVEKMNHTIVRTLAKYVSRRQDDWHLYVPVVCMAYNMCPAGESTQYSPYYLNFARHPRLLLDTSLHTPMSDKINPNTRDYITDLLDKLKTAREVAADNIKTSQQRSKARHDRTARDPNYEVGDFVYLHTPQKTKGHSPKLERFWKGPYVIDAVISPVNYRLRSVHGNVSGHDVVHANRLKRCWPLEGREDPTAPKDPPVRPDKPAQDQPAIKQTDPLVAHTKIAPAARDKQIRPVVRPGSPKNTIVAHDAEAPVETGSNGLLPVQSILKTRRRKGATEYLVYWKGYPKSQATWEPEYNLTPDLIEIYGPREQKS